MNSIRLTLTRHIFELRNIEVYERMSEETTAFCADVFINGVCVGQCQNSGKGEGNYPYIDNQYRNLYEAVEFEVVGHRYHSEYKGRVFDWEYSMDFLIGMMVSECWYNNRREYKF